jgi:hypothetical protein
MTDEATFQVPSNHGIQCLIHDCNLGKSGKVAKRRENVAALGTRGKPQILLKFASAWSRSINLFVVGI